MGEAKEIWKRLFFVLHNNKQPDDDLPTMWTPFKAENLQDGDLETAIESMERSSPTFRGLANTKYGKMTSLA